MKSKVMLLGMGVICAAAYGAKNPQWEAGMDDDAGKASATSACDLPAADYEGARQIYPKRDRLFTTSLNGTWAFKLVKGLETPDVLAGWNEPGYDTRDWDDIAVPGNWETQGLKEPQYGNQIDEMSGFYVRNFRWDYRWEGQRVILRFDGVLFGYEVWMNGRRVGRWGSAYNLAQWDVTDLLVKGRNTIAVKVMTRSRGWLFDTNDCWALAGIFRSVELFTVSNDYIEDITFTTDEIADGDARVSVEVRAGAFDNKKSKAVKAYVSLVDEDGVHALDFERRLVDGVAKASGVLRRARLWSVDSPNLYTLVVTLVDVNGKKIERIAEPQGVRIVRLVDKHLEINGEPAFLNGVAWNEIDPVLGRAITETERRRQMALMKKAGVNCIRTAHYPFGPDFLRLCDEMGFYVIDEVPFGSRGRELLEKPVYQDELLVRTEATMRRDKNHASVIFWTFGNENPYTRNTKAVLEYAKRKDPSRPRGLPQIGFSQAKEMLHFIDSWGDRATDGIVYGDGTPKDGYWLVKALYAGKLPLAAPPSDAPNATIRAFSAFAEADAAKLLLRIGRKPGMDMVIQTMGKPKPYRHDDYIVSPTLLSFKSEDGNAVYRLRWLIDGKEDEFIEGDVALTIQNDGRVKVEYDLKPSENCIANDRFCELGITLRDESIAADRVDWCGDGPLTSVPGKSKMNVAGTWAMHKDDYRFPGNRANVKWASAGGNKGRQVFVLESGTGNVSFENIDGHICLTENMAIAGYGGKASGPSGLKSPDDIDMKGEFLFYIAELPAAPDDVVPDLTYSLHYGF